MSKELIEVKKDSLKSKLKDVFLIFLILFFVLAIILGGIYCSYLNKKENNLAIENIVNNEKNNDIIDEKKENVEKKEENEITKLEEAKNGKIKNLEKIFKQEFLDTIIEEEAKIDTNNKLPKWNDTAIQDIKDIYGSTEKQVYLTFDDGPSKEVTPKILKILKEEQVPATFFVLGKSVVANPELVKQEYEEGHFIANHGYTHTYSQIYASVDNVYDEYLRANEAIKNAIENPEYDCHLFRFPGGSSGGPYDSLKAQAKQFLANNNIASTNWNCLTSDAAGNYTVESQYQGALETQGAKTSLIVLMHDAPDKKATPETLSLLIKHYKEDGYVFKNFYEIFNEEDVVEENVSNNLIEQEEPQN